MTQQQIPQADYSQMIANILGSKGGFDFSSQLMDPVMQYLNGNYQSAPQYTEDELFNKESPTFQWAGAEDTKSPWFLAARAVRQGVNPFTLKADGKMRAASGANPDDWSKFIDKLMEENQAVKSKMIDQTKFQDPFQKMGMPGANESYMDQEPNGAFKHQQAIYNTSPDFFSKLFELLPEQRAAQNAANAPIDAKYGGQVIAKTDSERMSAAMAGNNPLTTIQNQTLATYALQPDIQKRLIEQYRKLNATQVLKKAGGNQIVDKRATADRNAYGEALKAAKGRAVGTATDTVRRADDASRQLVAQMVQRGQTPLMDALLQAAILKKSTKNGN